MSVTSPTNGRRNGNSSMDLMEEEIEPMQRGMASPPDGILAPAPAAAVPGPAMPAAGAPRKPRRRKALLWLLGVALVVGAIFSVLAWQHAQRYESTDDATVEGRVIPISPQVSGRVKAVRVSDNQFVHRGDVMVEIEPTDFEVALDQALAQEAAAKGRLAEAQANVESALATRDEARAEVTVAEANASSAEADYNRYVEAVKVNAGSISHQQMDSATANWRSTAALIAQARAKLAAAEAQIATAKAAVDSAKGDLEKVAADIRRARVNLSYCTLRAPEDGHVTRKSVEPGAYVQTGQSLFALVPREFWIVANFKETQLTDMRPGQPVTITIDAYPQIDFHGTVDSIQSGTGARFSMIPSENATGNYVKVVQRIPAKIRFNAGSGDDDVHPLSPGMSAVPEVKVR